MYCQGPDVRFYIIVAACMRKTDAQLRYGLTVWKISLFFKEKNFLGYGYNEL